MTLQDQINTDLPRRSKEATTTTFATPRRLQRNDDGVTMCGGAPDAGSQPPTSTGCNGGAEEGAPRRTTQLAVYIFGGMGFG